MATVNVNAKLAQPIADGELVGESPFAHGPQSESVGHPNTEAESLVLLRRSSRSLAIMASLAVLYTLYIGRSLLQPVVLAIVLALLFRPIVRRLQKWRIPSFVGAAAVLAIAIGGTLYSAMYLLEPASEWLERVPVGLRLREVEDKLEPIREPIVELQAATAKLQEFGSETSVASQEAVSRVEIQQPSIASTVLSTTGEFAASAAICLIVLYFLLVLGDSMLNSVVQVMPRLREKREVVTLVRNVEQGVSCYLLTVTGINVSLGVVIGIGMWLVGLPNPALWGLMAAIVNFIPYVGALTGTVIVFLVGLFAFDSIGEALFAPIVYFGITSIEGNLVTPAILGNRMSLNPIVVFLSLAFWGWMWGIGGALLAVPLLAISKIAFDQFDSTRPLAVLVGR